jgi:hypothetical protein
MKVKALFLPIFMLSALSLYAQVDVLTQHGNQQRTGWNSQETTLNQTNVKPGFFGKLFSYPVDDQVYAQPLVATQVNIPGVGVRNVVYIATVNNSVYCFDADSLPASGAYWHISLTPAGTRPPMNSDMTGACSGAYSDFTGNIGIVGTPVINKSAGTIYLVSRSLNTGTGVFSQYLHALDITNGQEKGGSPVPITATTTGSGPGNVNGVITFNPQHQNQRPGLLLLNGIVYIGYSSHCDWDPYVGWVLGYDATSLQQKYVYADCRDDEGGGGIWMAGSGPAADSLGNIFLSTGNGQTGLNNDPTNPRDRGASMLRLVPSGDSLAIADYFTPLNYAELDDADLDLGGSECMFVPGLNWIFTGCKDGTLYVCNAYDLGQYNGSNNNVIQSISLGPNAHLRSSFSYYKGTSDEFIYTWSENTALKAWPVDRSAGDLDSAEVVTSGLQGPAGNTGAQLVISSNGSVDSTAILWATHAFNCDANHQTCPGILRAINANNVTQELWNSTLVEGDSVGGYAKWNNPTVANGKVYLGTFSNKVLVYGLANNGIDTCTSPNIALNQPAFASSTQGAGLGPANAFDGNMTTRWSSLNSDPQWLLVDLGQPYNLCKVIIYWETALGKDYNIQVSNDSLNWTTVDSVVGNTSPENVLNVRGAGRYVRMYGLERGTQYGYSIYEMQVYGTVVPTCFPPTNIQTSNLTQNGITISWDAAANATSYLLQYKNITDATWTSITVTGATSQTLSALQCGTDYLYEIATICSNGQTSAYSTSAAFTTPNCPGSCGPLPTRWTQSDIGNVGLAGQDCYSGNTFTLQGSGADIGGTADAFNFAYQTLTGDGQFVSQVVTQDQTSPNNKVGLMIRESIDPASPNAFVYLTSGSGAFFQYRATEGGSTTSNSGGSAITAPYWINLTKSGSTYTGYISPDGFTWTQVGQTVDLGFGAGGSAAYVGLAITSNNNSVLSTATTDNFSQSTPLAIGLTDFSGQDQGTYVALQWTTEYEQNTDHFEVQRSADGFMFSTITSVKAAGNSNVPLHYSASDNNPIRGLNYYRLKVVDQTGKFTYSPLILIRFGKSTAPLLFPNPVSSFFTLVAGQDPIRQVNVYDLTGRRLLSIFNGAATSNQTVSCSTLARGIYLVEIWTANGRFVQKMLKN